MCGSCVCVGRVCVGRVCVWVVRVCVGRVCAGGLCAVTVRVRGGLCSRTGVYLSRVAVSHSAAPVTGRCTNLTPALANAVDSRVLL